MATCHCGFAVLRTAVREGRSLSRAKRWISLSSATVLRDFPAPQERRSRAGQGYRKLSTSCIRRERCRLGKFFGGRFLKDAPPRPPQQNFSSAKWPARKRPTNPQEKFDKSVLQCSRCFALRHSQVFLLKPDPAAGRLDQQVERLGDAVGAVP